MKIYCFGNQLVSGDSTAVELIPVLNAQFPAEEIVHTDPSENFMPEEGSVLIDTVDGISTVQTFSDIDAFMVTKHVSVHDYDLGLHLQLLKKLHKLPKLHIIAIPRYDTVSQVKESVVQCLQEILLQERKDESEQ